MSLCIYVLVKCMMKQQFNQIRTEKIENFTQVIMMFFSSSLTCVVEHVYDCMCMCGDVKCLRI